MTRGDWLIFAGGVVAGVLAILAVGWAFYVVGRSEDRDRARQQEPPDAEGKSPERPGRR